MEIGIFYDYQIPYILYMGKIINFLDDDFSVTFIILLLKIYHICYFNIFILQIKNNFIQGILLCIFSVYVIIM